MGIHHLDAKPEYLTEFYALGPGYARAYSLLSPYQQSVVEAHVAAVGLELIDRMYAEFDVRRSGSTSLAVKPSVLQRLLSGQIDDAIIIGERSSLALVRRFGLVLINDVAWHAVH
jgi:hypothetical protein